MIARYRICLITEFMASEVHNMDNSFMASEVQNMANS